MKEFWKDYGKLCKETGRFYKNHWKGLIVLNAAIIGAEVAYCQYVKHCYNLNFGKKTKEENEAQ